MKNKLYFDKEKKLKITAALLVALSGILAGIVELFSNCDCCCVKAIDCDICPVKIVLLVMNIVAILTALIADIIGIIEYGKTPKDDFELEGFEEDPVTLPTMNHETLIPEYDTKETAELPKKDTNAPDKRLRTQNGIFLCSLITTVLSFALLCISVVVVTVI